MKIVIYDVECLNNCFLLVLKNVHTNKKIVLEISERKDDRQKIINIFQNKEIIFVGINVIDYDGCLISYLLLNPHLSQQELCVQLKNLSDSIIKEKKYHYKYRNSKLFFQIDLMRMLFSKELRVSLKELQVSMNYPNVLEMTIDWDLPIEVERIDELIYYCDNDVDSTHWVYERCVEDLKFRKEIQDEWGIECYSKDGMTIGVDILKEEFKRAFHWKEEHFKEMGTKRESIKLKDIVLPFIKYDTPILQDLLEKIKKDVLTEGKTFSYQVEIGGLLFTIGKGGIHSKNESMIYDATKGDFIIIDGDIDLILWVN